MSKTDLVLAIHKEHADAILAGRKTVELRRRFPDVDPGTVLYLYVTAPTSAIVGGCVVGSVAQASPTRLWQEAQHAACVSRTAFRAYFKGTSRGTGIRIHSPFRLRRPSQRAELAGVCKGYQPPQSLSYLKSSDLAVHLRRLRD